MIYDIVSYVHEYM